jgi:hypothetical protein
MKTKLDIKSTICGALLGAGLVFAVGAATSPRATWDYRIESVGGGNPVGERQAVLQKWAQDGWELHSVVSDSRGVLHFFFRRSR